MKSLNSPTKKVMIIAFSILFIVFLAWFGSFLHKYYTDHGEAMTYVYPDTGKTVKYYWDEEHSHLYTYDKTRFGKKTPFIAPDERLRVSPKEEEKLREAHEKASEEGKIIQIGS